MSHWNWTLILTGVATIAAVIGVVLAVGKALATRIDEGNRKNDQQLAKQRRVDRELFGEDPDNPAGTKGPSLRELVTNATDAATTAALNTRGLSDRMASAESRLGKLEDEVSFIKDVLIRPGGGS